MLFRSSGHTMLTVESGLLSPIPPLLIVHSHLHNPLLRQSPQKSHYPPCLFLPGMRCIDHSCWQPPHRCGERVITPTSLLPSWCIVEQCGLESVIFYEVPQYASKEFFIFLSHLFGIEEGGSTVAHEIEDRFVYWKSVTRYSLVGFQEEKSCF